MPENNSLKPESEETDDRVSSPAATGGAGTIFEQHVDAYWLALLLVRGIPPIIRDCTVDEVCLQTEHLGWHTDDFLIVGKNGSGQHRKLAGQVKLNFTVSATDDECKKAVQDFWKDFKNPEQFSQTSDRFALVTLRGTKTLLEYFSGLLDCARASRDGDEFERRLSTDGFISAKAVQDCDKIRKIIGEIEDRDISVAEVWPFLCVLHVLSLDLNSATGQTEAGIKTLLAHMTDEADAIGVADATWDALLREVGEGMPEARHYRHGDLPEELRQRHTPLGGIEQRVLRALNDHSTPILDRIRSKIGSLHLERGGLVQQVIEHLESNQVVLISGAAGSGKSVIAKDAISILEADHFAFSFRAEEFAHPHLNATLQSIQIPADAAMLGAILAGQNRKIMLVESVERLLEKSTRDAFTDLLGLAAKDKSWCLVLTCRDYSTDLVRSAFLESVQVIHSVVTVPPLDNEELDKVKAVHPPLSRPLANTALRRVLRNPYVLDKTLQFQWSEERPLPQSEREFRTLFWREIVRADHLSAHGMPYRRDDVFVQIALRRAQQLTLYADCGDLDSEVVDGLRHDSLIVSSQHSDRLLAPAHDVLEDWAILHWIQEQYVIHEESVRELSIAIGTHPAVRRTYRKWVSELVESNPEAADGLFQAAVREDEISAQFRDDTLVSLLRSSSSVAFLERHREELLANDNQLFRQVIHILRVACVTTPAWLGTSAAGPSLLNVPDGPAWASVLRLVQGSLTSFTREDRPLLLGLIEDWARGVSLQNPCPDGAEAVAAIAHWLLPNFESYGSNDRRTKILQVIAKIPNADRDRFATFLRGNQETEKRDRTTEEFRKIIFEGMDGLPAARDMPKLVVSAAKDYLLCSEADLQQEWSYGGSLELEPLFGLKSTVDSVPSASAYRGPFLSLLRYHPREGLTFVIEVFNHSAEWYAHPRVRSDSVEPPFDMTLTFEDGTSRTQRCNERLWNLYRRTSVGPYVLQSILMALEHWLLEMEEARPHDLDRVLLDILQTSDSAALTAVVASAATAFPHAAGETLLVLLRSRLCIQLDRQRFASEVSVPSQLDAIDEIYGEERKKADARPHRKSDLECAIIDLQRLGPLMPRVHEILDRHHAEMPPPEEQDDNDRVWRFALHRMDLRQYTSEEDAAEAAVDSEDSDSPEDSRRYIRFNLNEPEPDIREMLEQDGARLQALNVPLELLGWGRSVFDPETRTTHDPAQWQQRLEEAQAVSEDSGEEGDLFRDGPGIVAAVCVRDHWEEMSDDERDWCVDIICSEVECEGDHWDERVRIQRNGMSADRPCACVLPLLLGKSLSDMQRSRVHQMLVLALTHAIDEVRWYVASGIGAYLWTIDRELALRCANALATEAMLVQSEIDVDSERSQSNISSDRDGWDPSGWGRVEQVEEELESSYLDRRQVNDIEAESASIVRNRFDKADGITDDAHLKFDPTRGVGTKANARILAILVQAATEPTAIAAFERLAHTLVGWWDDDDHNRDMNEPTLNRLLEDFLLRTPTVEATKILQPILNSIDRHPREVHRLLQGLISVEDIQPNTVQFWSLWKLFADRIRCAEWLEWLDDRHAGGPEMISAVFFGNFWKKSVHHWPSLEGNTHYIHMLFEDLSPSSTVLDAYIRFLYDIGEQSLPDAFIRIANRLQEGDDPRQMMRTRDTAFHLETLLRRYVYGKPIELKRQRDLREAVLFLLDLLVENGSSAAFRMRDDFVTPISTV